jgi:hypothetical protein
MFDGQQAFDTEMQSFFYLFTRYLSERAKSVDLCVISFFAERSFSNIRVLSVIGIVSSLPPMTRL